MKFQYFFIKIGAKTLNLIYIHGELDILAIEAVEAEDVFVHSFASD